MSNLILYEKKKKKKTVLKYFSFYLKFSSLTFTTLWANSAEWQVDIFVKFPRKQDLTFQAKCLHSGKNKNIISECRLLKFLLRVLSIKISFGTGKQCNGWEL